MRRLAAIIAPALASLAAVATPATAHELQALAPGPARLDLGTANPARLVHATLLEPADQLRVAVTPVTGPIEVELLVPDRPPEQDRSGGALPRLQSVDLAEGHVTALDEPRPIRDDATGFGYLVVASAEVPLGDEAVELTVERGGEPTRVALRVGPPSAAFRSNDAERTPRALVLTRGWFETEPAGASDLPAADRTAPERTVAWFGLGIAAAGLLVAAWWVARGRATSRRRGAERAVRGPLSGD